MDAAVVATLSIDALVSTIDAVTWRTALLSESVLEATCSIDAATSLIDDTSESVAVLATSACVAVSLRDALSSLMPLNAESSERTWRSALQMKRRATASDLLGLAGARLPGHQAALDRADRGVEGERKGRQDLRPQLRNQLIRQ